MGTTTGVIVGGSNPQNNVTSNVNTGGGHFLYYGIIRANPVRGFGTFGNNNNNLPQEIIITITNHYYYHQEEMLGD